MASLIAVVDAGPLYAAADIDDDFHGAALDVLGRSMYFVIPALVVAEVTYFVGKRLGAEAEGRFLASLLTVDVQSPEPEDWSRMAELVRQYSSLPLGGTDASVVATAERLNTPLVVTLDRRHFGVVRPKHCDAFSILP